MGHDPLAPSGCSPPITPGREQPDTEPGRGREAPRRRFHELDGLRAVAVALVIFHHSVTTTVTTTFDTAGLHGIGAFVADVTRSGVDLFFVLSGVVLLRPYIRGQRRLRVGTYVRRRIERLWPPYLAAWLLAGMVVLLLGVHPTWYSREVLPRFAFDDFAAQVAIVNLGWVSYNGAWWSLSLELLFYSIAPLLVIVALRIPPPRDLVAITLLIIGVLMGTLSLGLDDPEDVLPLFFVYLPCFLLGTVIARHDLPVRVGLVLLPVGIAWVLVAQLHPRLDVHIGFGLLYAGMIVVAMQGAGRLRSSLSRPWLVWTGERSYSLFLVHFSVFYLASYVASLALPDRGALYFLLSRGIGLPTAALVAMILFSAVERRFARGLVTADAFWPWNVSPMVAR